MRVQIGEHPKPAAPPPDAATWARIVSPSSTTTQMAAWAIGIAAMLVMLAIILATSLAAPAPATPANDQSAPLAVVVTVLVLAIPAHEWVHAMFYPGGAFSPRITFIIWPRRIRFGVYYEGTVTRERWLLARTAPFILLAVVPLVILTVAAGSLNPAFNASLALLLLCNTLGAGGDLLGAAWVFVKIPPGSTLGIFSGKAYLKNGNLPHA